jgi:hypothetical protein
MTGRTSTEPSDAVGMVAAHFRASSRSVHSMRVQPPNCSLISAAGPSVSSVWPSRTWTVGCRAGRLQRRAVDEHARLCHLLLGHLPGLEHLPELAGPRLRERPVRPVQQEHVLHSSHHLFAAGRVSPLPVVVERPGPESTAQDAVRWWRWRGPAAVAGVPAAQSRVYPCSMWHGRVSRGATPRTSSIQVGRSSHSPLRPLSPGPRRSRRPWSPDQGSTARRPGRRSARRRRGHR